MSDWLRASLRVAGTARSRLACGLLLLFSGTADLFADPLTAAAASQMTSDGLSLRWDNVEGAPYRVAGEVPRYRFRQDLHTVGMDPAASITLRLGGGSVLRVQFLEGRAAAEHLKVFFSEGSGLARRLRPLGSALDGTVFYQPRSLRSGFVEIAWPTAAGQRAELALFVSRIAEEPRSAFYRHLISLPTELVKLSRRSRGDLLPESDSWWRLRRNVPVVASVEGPARVRLESRLAYPPKESSSSQEYSLGVTVAGNTVRDVLATAADQNAAYEISGEVRMVGRRRVSFIDVPPGSHELQVKAEAETLVRVLTRSARDTLAHPYPFPRKDPRRVGERMHRLASEWRNSNEVSGGPLLAAMEARSLATRLAGSAAERAAAISTYFRHSRFQGVVPRDGPASRQVSARFALPLLRGPHSRVVDFYLTPEQLAGVSSLSSAVFVRVPDEEGQALVYEIPPR